MSACAIMAKFEYVGMEGVSTANLIIVTSNLSNATAGRSRRIHDST